MIVRSLMLAPALSLSILSCFGSVEASPWRVVPGVSVGRVHLGENLRDPNPNLGPESLTPGREARAASGHIWHVWIGKNRHELDIYTVRNESGLANFVREIRVTSPSFHTSSGLRPGMAVKTLPGFESHVVGGITVMDNARQGISVEVKDGRCLALIVHPRGQNLDEGLITYPYPPGT